MVHVQPDFSIYMFINQYATISNTDFPPIAQSALKKG